MPDMINNTINPKITLLETNVNYISGVVSGIPEVINNTINPKIGKLESDLAKEITDRQNGDNTLSTKIDTEQQNRILADNAIIENI
jgi:hypothetical protein